MEAVKSAKHKERINELRLKYFERMEGRREAWNMTSYIWENRRALRTPTGNKLKRKYKRGGRIRTQMGFQVEKPSMFRQRGLIL